MDWVPAKCRLAVKQQGVSCRRLLVVEQARYSVDLLYTLERVCKPSAGMSLGRARTPCCGIGTTFIEFADTLYYTPENRQSQRQFSGVLIF